MPEQESQESLAQELATRHHRLQQDKEAELREKREQALVSTGEKVRALEAKKSQLLSLRDELDQSGADELSGDVEGVRESRKPLSELLTKYGVLLQEEGITTVRDLTRSDYHKRKVEVAGYEAKKAKLHDRITGLKQTKKRISDQLQPDTESDMAEEHRQERLPSIEELRHRIDEQVTHLDQEIGEVVEENKPIREAKIRSLHEYELQPFRAGAWVEGQIHYRDPMTLVEKVHALVRRDDITTAKVLGNIGGVAYKQELKGTYTEALGQGFKAHLDQKPANQYSSERTTLGDLQREFGDIDDINNQYEEVRMMMNAIRDTKRELFDAVYKIYEADENRKGKKSIVENEDDTRVYIDVLMDSAQRGLSGHEGMSTPLEQYEKYLSTYSSQEPFRNRGNRNQREKLMNPKAMQASLEQIQTILTTVLNEAKSGKLRGNMSYEISDIIPRQDETRPKVEPYLAFSQEIRSRIEKEQGSIWQAMGQFKRDIEKQYEPFEKAQKVLEARVDKEWAREERYAFADAHPDIVEEMADVDARRKRGNEISKLYRSDAHESYRKEDYIDVVNGEAEYPGQEELLARLEAELEMRKDQAALKQRELTQLQAKVPKVFGKEKHAKQVDEMREELHSLEKAVRMEEADLERVRKRKDMLYRGVGVLLRQPEVRSAISDTSMTISEFYSRVREVIDQLEKAGPAPEHRKDWKTYTELLSNEGIQSGNFEEVKRRASNR